MVKLEWLCKGKPVEIQHAYGLMAQLLPDRRSIALLRSSPRRRFAETLELIDALTPGRVSQLHAQALLRIRQLLYSPGS